MLAALVCVGTSCITIQTPPNGYVHIGDSIVLLCGWLLGPLWGFFAAGLGSALADFLLGYAVYAPVSFLIKGLMAMVAFYIFSLLAGKRHMVFARILSAALAEVVMIVGYYLFDGFIYGFAGFLASLPGYSFQAIAGIVLGVALIRLLEKTKLKF